MTPCLKTILIFVFLAAFALPSHAQWYTQIKNHLRWSNLQPRTEFHVQLGTSGYIGEINSNVFGFNQWTVGGGAKYYFNEISASDRTWGIRLDYNLTRIAYDDANSRIAANRLRGYSFENSIHEASLAGEFHFFDFRPRRGRNSLSPYVFAGVGMIWHLPSSTPAGYRSSPAFTLPVGVGIKQNLPGSLTPWSIGLETNYRNVFSDSLDGFDDDPGTDWFMTATFRITYTLYKYRDPLW